MWGVPFLNCRQFMYLVISLLILRAGCGIWLYQFLIIAYLFTFQGLIVKYKIFYLIVRIHKLYLWIKPGARGSQCSPEWTAIKASFNISDFQLPWQQIKMRNLYNFIMLGGGLLNKHL